MLLVEWSDIKSRPCVWLNDLITLQLWKCGRCAYRIHTYRVGFGSSSRFVQERFRRFSCRRFDLRATRLSIIDFRGVRAIPGR